MTTSGSFSFSSGTRWFSRGTKTSSISNGELSALHLQPSRIESAHALLKRHMKSTSNLLQLHDSSTVQSKLSTRRSFPQWRQRRFACHSATGSPFSKSWCIASLLLPWVQLNLLASCTRTFTSTFALPCAMSCWTICSAIVRWNSRRSTSNITYYQSTSSGGVATGTAAWWAGHLAQDVTDRVPSVEQLREGEVVNLRRPRVHGRPAGARNNPHSTRRNPSEFEHVEAKVLVAIDAAVDADNSTTTRGCAPLFCQNLLNAFVSGF